MKLFNKKKKMEDDLAFSIGAPVKGKVIDIKETNDEMFKIEALGKGVGIIAQSHTITAPISGTITSFFPTKHAIGITNSKGVELLIHIGIDTVELNGQYFHAKKKQGDFVTRGEVLLDVEFENILQAGYDNTVLMVITNTAQYKDVITFSGDKKANEIVIEIEEK